MKNKYVEKRERLISEIVNLSQVIYKDDREMLSIVSDLTTSLEIADPNEEFINGMWGFMLWASNRTDVNSRSVLTTLLHDLGEFASNRHEKWFCPRTSGYQKYLSGASNVKVI